jgi:hypothetical protein
MTCAFPGCDHPVKAIGYCSGHCGQYYRLGVERMRPLGRVERLCSFPGCTEKHAAGGLCKPHWAQQRRGTALREVRARQTLRPPTLADRARLERQRNNW